MNRQTRKTLLSKGHAVIYRDNEGIERVLVYADKESADAYCEHQRRHDSSARVVSHAIVLGQLKPGQTE